MKEPRKITAADLPNVSAQEVFDFILYSVLKQGVPCMTSSGVCVYTNEAGQHCAAGFLLPESHEAGQPSVHVWDVWCYVVGTPLNSEAPDGPKVPDAHAGLISACQRAHDSAGPTRAYMDYSSDPAESEEFCLEFTNNMTLVAEYYNLRMPECVTSLWRPTSR